MMMLFQRPASSKAVPHRCSRNAENPRPLRKRMRLSSMTNPAIAAGVVVLLVSYGPSTVTRLIAAVVVNSVQGVCLRWALSDASDEGFEVGVPFLAHEDPASAVAVVLRVARIRASHAHLLPNPVFGSSRPTVSAASGSPIVVTEAAATFRIASPEAVSKRANGCAAVTGTRPHRGAVLVATVFSHDEQAPESSIRDVYKGGHAWANSITTWDVNNLLA